MRLDADEGDSGWLVWHVEDCRRVPAVWVDDATAQWAEYVQPLVVVERRVARRVHQARRILILAAPRVVLIDPVADPACEQLVGWLRAATATTEAAADA